MILEVVQSKWSLTWYYPLGPRMCVLELMNGHVLQTLREQLKDPGSRLEGSELLTSEFLRFRSRLNETSGGLGKIGAVSGSDCRILKFLRTAFLEAKLLGWKVSVKGIRSSLSEADGSKADSLLTRCSKCDEMSNFFSERGYPDSILSKALNRVQNVNRMKLSWNEGISTPNLLPAGGKAHLDNELFTCLR